MEQISKRVFKEHLIAACLVIAGVYAFSISLRETSGIMISTREVFLPLFFVGSIILADRYPIHLLRGTKLSLINLPIFLSIALLSAPLAILVTGIGLLIASLLARVERGSLPRDIAAAVGQWMLTVYLGYQLLHLQPAGFYQHISRLELLLLCALLFLMIDFTVFSLSQSLIYDEPFLATLKSVVKQGFSLEVIQYFIAVLGVLAADKDIWSLILLLVPLSITYVAFKNIKEIRYETVRVLNDMADTVDLRDICTGGHSKQVADLVHRTLIQLKLSGPEATLIEISARLHDIGKIGIPDRLLLKPGKLSEDEMAVMQTHAQKGAELISKYKDFSRGAQMIRHHHERWDGHGYPAGLRDHEIPFGARVIAVADSFEAMTSDRPYRRALSVNQAIRILLEGRGKQWDPKIVNAFVDMVMTQIDSKRTDSTERQAAPGSLDSIPVSQVQVFEP